MSVNLRRIADFVVTLGWPPVWGAVAFARTGADATVMVPPGSLRPRAMKLCGEPVASASVTSALFTGGVSFLKCQSSDHVYFREAALSPLSYLPQRLYKCM